MERMKTCVVSFFSRILPQNSLTRRWFRNAFCLIVLFLLVLQVLFTGMLRYYYYESVENALESRAALYRRTMELSAGTETAPWELRSRKLIAYFTDKDKMELQVLDHTGQVLLSSSGFVPSTEKTLPDYQQAVVAANGCGVWQGRTRAGEPVMALTMIETDDAGVPVGALRYVSSLLSVNRQVFLLSVLLFGFILLIIFFVLLSGSYFIRSIVTPVLDIGRTARRIAMGEYDARLERRYNDEVGDLCDTINFMAGEISTAEQMKNEFISSVSHELRTPLTAIKGWSETLLSAPEDRQLTEQGLDVIGKEAQRLSGLVEELLDFSRMVSGRMALRWEKLDVLAELEEALFLFRDRATRAGVELQYCESAELPPIWGDADRIKQVFVNLLDNAVKYSRFGDCITVQAAAVPEGVNIIIRDTGIGIPAEALPHIRQKFYQVDANAPGSGIGLALVEEIVQLHRGRLDIDSQPNEGTVVTVFLPAQPPHTDTESM